jgi:uncharacterized protein (TIGR03790 family)
MKKQILTTIVIIFLALSGFAQIVNYDDVGVIVNDNSSASLQIGEYFKQARNIPEQNMIHIETVIDEAIDTTEFRNIQYQVKNYILQQGLENKLNYLVTTKGVPFDIQVDSCSHFYPPTWMNCSSVESELTLLLSADSSQIIQGSWLQNHYYNSTEHIGNASPDLLLVSRLDGENAQDVFNLIDRSGPETVVDKEFGKFIFDISYTQDPNIFNSIAAKMYPAIDTLNSRGWNTMFDSDSLVPNNEENVLGYIGFIKKIYEEPLDFDWEKACFTELMITGPNVTFYDSLNYANTLQLSQMIGEGCTAGSVYVHAPFSSQFTDYAVFFDRFTKNASSDLNNPYNLAESYYMATKTLSWMNLLVGDPKTTITTQNGNAISKSQVFEGLAVFPNPAREFVNVSLNSNQTTGVTISILDQMGRLAKQTSHDVNSGRNAFQIDVSGLHEGLYFIGIKDEAGKGEVQKVMIRP